MEKKLRARNTGEKRGRRICLSFVLSCILVLLFAAGAQAAVTKLTIPAGGKMTLKVKGVSLNKAKWSNTKKAVATVSKKGVVTGRKTGTAKITAKVGKKSYVWSVSVKKLKLSTSKAALSAGGTLKLTLKGLSGSGKPTWKSANTAVAKVSSGGVVTAAGAGNTKVTAKYCGKSYTCSIAVNNAVRLSASSLTLQPDAAFTLSLQGAGGAVAWSSSNSAVARVDGLGRVTAVKAGSAKVTASYGGTSYVCSVTVKAPATTTVITRGTTTVTIVKPVAGSASTEITTSSGNAQQSSSTGRVTYPAGSKENAVYKILMGFQKKYPEGLTFTNDDYRTWVGGIYRGGYGCAGFCFELSDACFAPNLADMRTTNLTKDLKPGDIIRLDYNTHSVIVTEVYKDEVVVAEANYNSSVHWGRHISFEEIKRTGTNVITRYEASSASAIKGLMEIIDTLPDLHSYNKRVK